ncbi:MAG: DUF5916 domain-containing protein, partial [Acidobacteriota bacterium]|nr:DUF5916 domain-containing protein [Acidobacteriota bacterium]
PDGWSMEFAIPYSSLRFRAAGPQVWGFNLRRVIRWKNEHVSIAPIPASATTRAMYKFDIMATVVGVETPAVRKPIDVKPYAIAASTTNLAATPVYRNDPSADAGVDVKYSLTNSLVADLTYRTDFAQVEEDQQQVNLTRFSLFFPEKRDFFLEGQGLFTFGGSQSRGGAGGLTPIVFYSRRIGLGATGEIPIIGGGRVAGRAGKYSIGLLSIQTEDEPPAASAQGATAGQANYSVVRLRRDVLRRSNIGAIVTRKTPIDGITNTVLGVDANLWFYQNVTMTGYFAQSETEAPAKAGGYIDESPAKAGRHIDRSSYRGEFEYAPDRYGLRYEHLVVGRDFQPEIGFLRRTAFRRNFASARFSPRPASASASAGQAQPGPIRRHVFEGEFDYITGTDGVLETRQAQVSYDAELRGNDQWSIEYSNNYEHLRVGFNVVPGKPIPAGTYRFSDVRTTYEFGPQRRASGSVFGGTGTFYDGTKTELGARGVVEISSRFNVEPGITVNWIDIPAGAFTTAVTSVRTTFMFSPYMALGGLVQHNSTSKTLGSSVRLRWEYAPSSDLFVVYSDGRDTRIGDRFPGLQNRTFVVKATKLFRF